MGLPMARTLYRKWFREERYAIFAESINRALEAIGLTDEYIEAVKLSDTNPPLKLDLKDEVWGMVTVEGGARALLDSPVMQRLRRVRQLGFSYLVYPSADHSRFSHSLGVYHVAKRYAEEFTRRHDDPVPLADGLHFAKLSETDELDLFHAAMLHDVGHLPFSHATEAVFHSAKEEFLVGGLSVKEFLVPAQHLKTLKLSEALSIAIVLSPRFQKFYTAAVRDDADAPYRIALLIAGKPFCENDGALPELISGSIDADKIDYLLRDSRACNIPIGIDVTRLFLRSAIIEAVPDSVPEGVTQDRPIDKNYTMFGVNASGIDTVEEVALARTVLYQRVYSHRVTRNAERLLTKAFFSALESKEAIELGLNDAIEIWQLGDEELLSILRKQASSLPIQAQKAIKALTLRQLPRRACAFGPSMVSPLLPIENIFKGALDVREARRFYKVIHGGYAEQLKSDSLFGRSQENLEQTVLNEALLLCKTLRKGGISNLPKQALSFVSILPLPDLGKREYTGIVLESYGIIGSAKDYTKIQQLMDAEEMGKMVGFVHADREWGPLVALAFRNIIYDYFATGTDAELKKEQLSFSKNNNSKVDCHYLTRFRIDIDKLCRRARIDIKKFNDLHEELTELGYYDKKPPLAKRYNDAHLTSIANNFIEFAGERSWRVSKDSVQAFLEQFRPKLRSEMAELLKDKDSFVFLSREKTVNLLNNAIDKITYPAGYSYKYIAPLSPNSGNFVRFIFEQDLKSSLEKSGWTFCHSIVEVLGKAKPGETLILCDDNVSSGSQALAQFLRWFDKPRDEWPEELQGEAGIDDVPLSKNDQERLKQLQIGISVCVKGGDAEERLQTAFRDLGVDNFLGITSGETLTSMTAKFESLSPELQKTLKSVGQNVLMHARQKDPYWTEREEKLTQSCEDDALGYGGLKGLFATPFNVPTSTIPALWCPGVVNGEPWMPLFIRRGYLKHLVVA